MLSIKKLQNLLLPAAVLLGLFILPGVKAAELSNDVSIDFKYQNLFRCLDSSERSTDFIAFTDFEVDNDKENHIASLEYLTSNPKLIDRIRDDLGTKEIHWQLEQLSHRLLYVPERRLEVAELFVDYCRETITDLLRRTGLTNPYNSISIFGDDIGNSLDEQGINAVIVQDLAHEYVARYQFSGDTDKRIEIGLSERMSINEVGSYSSFIEYSEESDDWQFSRNRQTVWKSVSANPYTVLMTPLEETLHIALREYTERAILVDVKARQKRPSITEVKELVEEWLAVEEAIVGGLVYFLIPDLVIQRVPDLPREWIQDDLDTKAKFPKYRFLQKAIKMVKEYGLKESIHLYAQDPVAARNLFNEPG